MKTHRGDDMRGQSPSEYIFGIAIGGVNLMLAVAALLALTALSWVRARPCKRCGARLDPALVREHGCAMCEERGS